MRNRTSQQRAQQLRQNASDTERYLWTRIRRRQLGGYRFRRQVPIGNYIVDFACLESRLVIELDGSQHGSHRRLDEAWDLYLQHHGFRVLRFWDNQVFEELEGVLEASMNALQRAPAAFRSEGFVSKPT